MKHGILIFVFLFLFESSSYSKQGILFLERGSVKLMSPPPNSQTRIIDEDFSKVIISSGEKVHTGKNTSVKIKIRGKKEIIELSSSVFFQLGKITKKRSRVSLFTGKAKFKIRGKKSKKKKFLVRTITATIGVKGTDFVLTTTNAQTNLLTLSGIVTLAPISMPDVEIEVLVNEASSVEANTPPTEPVIVTPEVMEEIINSDSPDAFENVEFGEELDADEVRQDNKEKKKKEEQEELVEEEEEKPLEEPEEKIEEEKPTEKEEFQEEPKEEFEPKEEGEFQEEPPPEGEFKDERPRFDDKPMYEENEEFDGELMFEDGDFKDEPMFDEDFEFEEDDKDYEYQFEEEDRDYEYEDDWKDEPIVLDTGEVITQEDFQDTFDEQQDTTWETEDDYDDYDDMYEEIENTLNEVEKYREIKIKIKRH
jgi:hypothetical protein